MNNQTTNFSASEPATDHGHVRAAPEREIASVYLCTCLRLPFWTLRGLQAIVMELATGNPLVHAAIAYDGAVLDPSVNGDKFYSQAHFELTNEQWKFRLDIPVWPGINLDAYTDTRPRPVWKTLLRWATLGTYQTRDCVSSIVVHLRAGGVAVHNWIVTPPDLAQWLLRNYNVQVAIRHPDGTVDTVGQAPGCVMPTRPCHQAV